MGVRGVQSLLASSWLKKYCRKVLPSEQSARTLQKKTTHRWQTNDPCHKAKTIRGAVSFGILRKRLLLQLASLLPQNKYHRRTSKRWRYVKINFYHLLTTTNAFITSCVASFVTSYVNTATDKGVLFLRIDEAFYANFKSLKLIAQFDRSLQDRQAWFK